MNLCLRPKAVEVVSSTEDVQPPAIPDDAGLRGRAAELHRQLSHMNEPVVVPRDQLVINLDFDDVTLLDQLPPRVALQARPTPPYTLPAPAWMSVTSASSEDLPAGSAPTAAMMPPPAQLAQLAPATVAAATTAGPGAESSCDTSTSAMAGGGGPISPHGGGASGAATTAASAGRLGGVTTTTTTATGSTNSMAEGTPGAGGGAAGHTRGFVRVKSVRPPQGLSWTHSRKCLEVLIAAEKGKRCNGYLSHEQRLRERLERLNLEMLIVAGDGNCQFRSISNELYGTQDHHPAIRRQAVSHILEQRPAFEAFLGEDFDQYVRQMERNGTWGDELTLRAVCDSFGLTVHVVTSEEDHWYLTYQPESRKLDREIFLTYIAPIHYNSIRRRSSLKTMALSVSRSFKRIGSGPLSLPPGGPASGPTSPTNATSPGGGVGRPLHRAQGPEGDGDGEAGSPGGQPVRLRLPVPGDGVGGRDGGGVGAAAR